MMTESGDTNATIGVQGNLEDFVRTSDLRATRREALGQRISNLSQPSQQA